MHTHSHTHMHACMHTYTHADLYACAHAHTHSINQLVIQQPSVSHNRYPSLSFSLSLSIISVSHFLPLSSLLPFLPLSHFLSLPTISSVHLSPQHTCNQIPQTTSPPALCSTLSGWLYSSLHPSITHRKWVH